MRIESGLDRLGHDSGALVAGKSVALLAHPASVDSQLQPARLVLEKAGAHVTALLGPEHGLNGAAQDMERVRDSGASDGQSDTSPKAWSLYGDDFESLSPTEEMLSGADLLVVDLQDIGTRYYTFVWTAALTLEVCAKLDLPMLVLDRPNPLNGIDVEGPGVRPEYRSFVGWHDVPTRHGLTIGEMLRLYALERGLEGRLEVLSMRGWQRGWWFDQSGLPWVLPSPNMPTLDTATVYPGTCLLEGTTVSEGRGTTRPFEIVGAPWIDGEALAGKLADQKIEGCLFRPLRFKPTFQKHAGETCGGVQIHVIDRRRFQPLRTGVALLKALWDLSGKERERFWRREPYEFVNDRLAIDLLAGGPWLREGIEGGKSVAELCEPWLDESRRWEARRARALLYE